VATTDIQARFKAGFTSSVRFRVSEGMVANFAAEAISAPHQRRLRKRSIYSSLWFMEFCRSVLVFGGRLALMVLSAVCAIGGRFASPVYIGDARTAR
jgi:hypothetical protein